MIGERWRLTLTSECERPLCSRPPEPVAVYDRQTMASTDGRLGFSLADSERDGRAVVLVGGDLDLAGAAEFVAGVGARLKLGGSLLLDLSALAFIDSSGLRALDEILREADQKGASLTISSDLPAPVRRLLDLTGSLATLPFEPEPDNHGL